MTSLERLVRSWMAFLCTTSLSIYSNDSIIQPDVMTKLLLMQNIALYKIRYIVSH